jgi:predicted transcriptional regulator
MSEIKPIATFQEEVFTVEELAAKMKLHRSTIQKMFLDVEGVVRIGHGRLRSKRAHYTLRIPASVARRVFEQMRVA